MELVALKVRLEKEKETSEREALKRRISELEEELNLN